MSRDVATRYALADGQGGVVYQIHADKRFVDVNASLQKFTEYAGELEQTAIGYIAWEQIEGWYTMTPGMTTKEGLHAHFQFNKDFDSKYLWTKGRGAAPELCGFPKGHKAYKQDLWKDFKDIPVEETIKKIMVEVCSRGKVTKRDNICLKRMGYTGDYKPGSAPGQSPKSKGDAEGQGKNKGQGGQSSKNPSGKKGEIIRLAEEIGEKEFARVAEKQGFVATIENNWKSSLATVEAKALSRTKISTKTLVNAGGAALSVAGIGLWAKGVFDVFSTHSTDLDKAAAVTAIIPFVGCTTELASKIDSKRVDALDAVDSGLCYVGDALMLGAVTAPLGIVVHLSRFLLQYFEPPPKLPSINEIRRMRDRPWNLIYGKIFGALKSKSWRKKLDGATTILALGLLSQGSEAIGVLEAGGQFILEGDYKQANNSFSKREIGQVKSATQPVISQLREKVDALIIERQRQYMLSLPKRLQESLKISIGDEHTGYNHDFIRKLRSEATITKYPGYSKYLSWAKSREDLYQEARARMQLAQQHLLRNPFQLPSSLDLAYYIGMAAGINHPPPNNQSSETDQPTPPETDQPALPGTGQPRPSGTDQPPPSGSEQPESPGPEAAGNRRAFEADFLNPSRFYKDKAGKVNWTEVHKHTLAIKGFLEGTVDENSLPFRAAGLPEIELHQFHLLITMHIGYFFADWKESSGHEVGAIPEEFQNGTYFLEVYSAAATPLAKDLPEFRGARCESVQGRPIECGAGLTAEEYTEAKKACKRYWYADQAQCFEWLQCDWTRKACYGTWVGPKSTQCKKPKSVVTGGSKGS